jgi:uncharacterized protein involved in exopolysaccharide biosynthesis
LESNHQNQSLLSEEVSVKEIVIGVIKWYKYILSKELIIAAIAILGAIAGFLYAYSRDIKFLAVSTFVLQENMPNNSQGSDFASFMGLNIPDRSGLFQGENLLQLYQTRFMIKKTVLRPLTESNQRLIDMYLDINDIKEKWQQDPKLKHLNFSETNDKRSQRMQDSVLTVIVSDIKRNYLTVNKPDRNSIIKIEVKSKNEEFAKLLNDQLVKTVNDYYIETKTKKDRDNLSLLQHQTDSIRAEINGAMRRIATNTQINLNPARATLQLPAQRSQVTSETNRAILNEMVRDLEVSKMALRKETPLIQIMEEPVFPLEKIHVSRLKFTVLGAFGTALLAVICYSIGFMFVKILE